MAKEALAFLQIPKKDAVILPGYGCRPPDGNKININIDCGMSMEARKGGAGGVAPLARSSSTFLGAWSKPHPGITDPLIAEALPLRDGVIFARPRGYPDVETDCFFFFFF
jgi:hypothetical protein